MGDGSVWTSAQPWKVAVREVIQDFLGVERRAGRGSFPAGRHRPFAEVLAGSGFPEVEEHVVETCRPRDVESVIGYLHSTSFAAEHLFGDRVDEFRDRVRHVLASHLVDGVVEDRNEFRLVLARRATPTTPPPS
ncbi:hypothetical protein [Nocardioides sp. TF02-7]|uniref:hypothetical protein n=1 Tax=Nocardioides sp. TF02-7 TaxID=2917724 RepID=UPI001F055242|nr:hypothetical protein [Nocardioides sp. TF02-7]UMG93160.1 hypothetical protein MF408_02275 [Nocardioides sp. TF02-7]